jgi:hypothetical protein
VEKELGQPGGLEKNVLQIAFSLSKAWEAGKRSEHLDNACAVIVNPTLGVPIEINSAQSVIFKSAGAPMSDQDMRPQA